MFLFLPQSFTLQEPTLRDLHTMIPGLHAWVHLRDDEQRQFAAGVHNELAKLTSQNLELSERLVRILNLLQV
ncbi:hypothetical protein L873DRAFT_1817536 [Choiromyces venosus 120613-1]|uniref:Uncharacterized protein n=1 Tax=Choiromyces venosus 120613-1 TaxID=1336337 RepID=A0A3N4J757_9PEZI|nr:hypothetical protein L873DRAFT_1817536 [Choiromyces venosus 120613-1]